MAERIHVSPRVMALLAAAYAAALVYGSIFPLQGWRPPTGADLHAWLHPWADLSFSDLVTNAVIYVPFGVLLGLALIRRGPIARVGVALTAAALLSGGVEAAQLALPYRVSSPLDWGLNVAGAAVGAAFAPALTLAHWPIGRHRMRTLTPVQRLALAATAFWVAGEWHPFVPSINPLAVWQSIKPLWLAWQQPALPDVWPLAADAAEPLVVALLLQTASHGHLRNRLPLYGVLPGVLFVKVLIVSRSIDGGDLLGMLVGTLTLAALGYGRVPRTAAITGIAVFVLVLMLRTVSPDWAAAPGAFNWIPLRAHLQNPLVGIGAILESGWYALGMVALLASSAGRHTLAVAAGGVLAVLYAAILEWLQRWQVNRVPDITELLFIALFVGLGVAWWHGQTMKERDNRGAQAQTG